jgi:uncharacterized membrane protein YbaN (DUF454 family)
MEIMAVKDEIAMTVPPRRFFHRMFWILSGTALVIIGGIALFIPLIPTTPFLLLGAACYAKSSLRFYGWLKRSPVLGDYVRSSEVRIPLPGWVLVLTIVAIWSAVICTSLFLVKEPYLQLILIVVAVTETILLPLWNRKPR